MKRGRLLYSICIVILAMSMGFSSVLFSDDLIEKIKLNNDEIPEGFILGKIPGFAQKVFANNPCYVNDRGIKVIADKIYPGGYAGNLKTIHVTILAGSHTPYGDDMVCYIMVFKDDNAAKKELKKLKEYSDSNRDRTMLIIKDTLAVFIHADDTEHYRYIESIGNKIRARLQKTQ